MSKLIIPLVASLAGVLVGAGALLIGAMVVLVCAEEEVCRRS